MTRTEIIDRLSTAEAAGIPCPACDGPTGVLYTKHPRDHITRRRVCGRCELAFTTAERVVGGYSPEDLEQAKRKFAEWQRVHGGVITPIAPNQRALFKIEELELDSP